VNTRPGDPRFYRLLDEIANLHARKSSDYSPGSDPLANFRASAEFGVRPYLGILTRLRDKWGRLVTMAKGGTPMNESARDSHIDSAVYHLIAVLLLEDEAQSAPFPLRDFVRDVEPVDPEVEPPYGCMGDPDPEPVSLAVAGSDEPAGVYVDSLDEPFPLPAFGPGSPAATANRHYVGEDESTAYHPV
jgi:hypothetical protein